MKNKRIRVVLALLVIFAGAGSYYWWYQKRYPTTANAYIGGNVIRIASQVSGKIAKVYVINDQYVRNGQPLIAIDSQTYDLVAAEARTKFDSAAEAAGNNADDAKDAVRAISDNTDKLRTALDAYDFAASRFNSVSSLPGNSENAEEELDRTYGDVRKAQSDLDKAFDDLEKARKDISETGPANIQLRAAIASLQRAELDRMRTNVTAQSSGWVANLEARPGNVIQAGQPLFALVEDSDRWVDANFRETDLDRIRPGQPVTIEIDMYPGLTLNGKVESLSGGSGAVFSALPPENATGNWVKVSQRFTVKISVDDFPYSKTRPLRIGSSAWVKVDTTGVEE